MLASLYFKNPNFFEMTLLSLIVDSLLAVLGSYGGASQSGKKPFKRTKRVDCS